MTATFEKPFSLRYYYERSVLFCVFKQHGLENPLANHNITSACRITGDSPSAIAVIEIVGPDAKSWLDRNWKPNHGSGKLQLDTIRYGQIIAEAIVGESVIVCRTGPERYEVHCHGGKIASQMLLQSMQNQGIQIQSPQAWVAANEKDPFVAQATMALTQATTLRTAKILLDQQQGALSRALANIDTAIQKGDFTLAMQLADQIRTWDRLGQHLIVPFDILVCGPPNVGKSSLLNRILGYQRAIVHQQAGTTRDLLSEISSIDGWPVRLTDSAGIRATWDAIESIGVQRAVAASRSSDLQLILVDPIEGWTGQHQQLLDEKPTQSLIVITKSDLADCPMPDLSQAQKANGPSVQVSAVTGNGIPELLSEISKRLVPVLPESGQAITFTDSQRQALEDRYQRSGKYTSV
jgi:tRNA modification GTPase